MRPSGGGGRVDAKRLEKIPLFAELSRRDREQVARWADEIDVPEGHRLVDEGRFPHEFFVIERGTVEVIKDGQHVADLGPGDFFGEIAIVEHERRTASVVSTTPLRAIVMFAREFELMQSEMPSVAEKVHRAIRERLARDSDTDQPA
jgi:CRP/FNR family transcriptional regulator, cyclic AMP receptor protein